MHEQKCTRFGNKTDTLDAGLLWNRPTVMSCPHGSLQSECQSKVLKKLGTVIAYRRSHSRLWSLHNYPFLAAFLSRTGGGPWRPMLWDDWNTQTEATLHIGAQSEAQKRLLSQSQVIRFACCFFSRFETGFLQLFIAVGVGCSSIVFSNVGVASWKA